MPGALALAQAENAKGVQGSGPAVEENRPAQTATDHQDAQQFAFPVRIVEEPEEADRTRKREDDSDQREKADLIEQRRAANAATRGADSAERQEDLSLAQAIFAGLGTIGLIAALILTVQSNKAAMRGAAAAEKAVLVAQDTAKRQLRAYISVTTEEPLRVDVQTKLHVRFALHNRGQTPAIRLEQLSGIVVLPFPLPGPLPPIIEGPGPKSITTLGAGGTFYGNARSEPFSREILDAAITGENVRLYVIGTIKYYDVFGDDWATEFCVSVVFKDPTSIKNRLASGETIQAAWDPEHADQHNTTT